jgi:hypothetical protein
VAPTSTQHSQKHQPTTSSEDKQTPDKYLQKWHTTSEEPKTFREG